MPIKQHTISKQSVTLPFLKKIAKYSPKNDKIIVIKNNTLKLLISLFDIIREIKFINEK